MVIVGDGDGGGGECVRLTTSVRSEKARRS